jgi:hypothetical protein
MDFRYPKINKLSRLAAMLLIGWIIAVATTAQAGYRGPFEGRVVDAETLQPIQGAVVFVQWTYVRIGMEMETLYDTAEVLTDEQGYFRIKKKWSWNPWTNWRLMSNAIIFKGGYASFQTRVWWRLPEFAERYREMSVKEGQRVPAAEAVKIEYENGHFLFLLKKLTTEEERLRNIPYPSGDVPEQDMQLLEAERSRERKSLGRND